MILINPFKSFPSGGTTWWEIDALDAPFIFSIDGNYASIGATVVASDNIVYEPLVLTGIWPNSTDGFDPSGGNLTPVFWSSQSEPAEWSAGDYAAGEAVWHMGDINPYYFANSAASPTDIPGISGVWTVIPTYSTGIDYIAGIGWVDYSGGGAFYKCEIQNGPGTDLGTQDPGSPTQFWQVYAWQVWASGTTYALSDLALKTDYSAWYHSLENSNLNHNITG